MAGCQPANLPRWAGSPPHKQTGSLCYIAALQIRSPLLLFLLSGLLLLRLATRQLLSLLFQLPPRSNPILRSHPLWQYHLPLMSIIVKICIVKNLVYYILCMSSFQKTQMTIDTLQELPKILNRLLTCSFQLAFQPDQIGVSEHNPIIV